MKNVLCLMLAASMLAVLCFAVPAESVFSNATPMTDREAGQSVGGGAWSQFFSGVGCGLGVTLALSGYMSGLGAPAAALITVGTLKACADAFGM